MAPGSRLAGRLVHSVQLQALATAPFAHNGATAASSMGFATQHVVSAETAQEVAQQHKPLMVLPEDMMTTVDGYMQEAGMNGRHARERTRALLEHLQRLSHSQARGGISPHKQPAEQGSRPGDLEGSAEALMRMHGSGAASSSSGDSSGGTAIAHTRAGRVRASAISQIEHRMESDGLFSLSAEELHAFCGLPAPPPTPAASAAAVKAAAAPVYNRQAALAYALGRMPGAYSAVHRVLAEIRARHPGYAPREMLDWGSGPGTAIWAAQEVWPQSLNHVGAIEPSPAMAGLARRLEASRRFAHPRSPMVTWAPSVADLAKRRPRLRRRHDLVVSAYVLTELGSAEEREAAVQRLWDLTGDILVLVEPGTPNGFSNILEARTQLLSREGRRAMKLARKGRQDQNLLAKSKRFGAHVVAPCAHDGTCPMSGQRAWCHFGQRYQHPGFMQEIVQGAAKGRGHSEEHYSYVVIRRGPRLQDVPDVSISRTFDVWTDADASEAEGQLPDDDDEPWQPSEAAIRAQMRRNRQLKHEQQGQGVAGATAEGNLHIPVDVFDSMARGSFGRGSWPAAGAAARTKPPADTEEAEDAAPAPATSAPAAHWPSTEASAGPAARHSASNGSAAAYQGAAASAAAPRAKLPLDQAPSSLTEALAGADLEDEHTLELLQALADALDEDLEGSSDSSSSHRGSSSGDDTGSSSGTDRAAAVDGSMDTELSVQQQEQELVAGKTRQHLSESDARFGPFSRGLVDHLIALEDQGLEWGAGASGEALTAEAAEAARVATTDRVASSSSASSSSSSHGDSAHSSLSNSGSSSAAGGRTRSRLFADQDYTQDKAVEQEERRLAITQLQQRRQEREQQRQERSAAARLAQNNGLQPQQQEDGLGSAGEEVGGAVQGAEGRELAQAASARWSRIVRPPRLRGGHVILDVCAPAEAPSSIGGSSGSSSSSSSRGGMERGQLERHIIAKSDASKWMGQAGYRLARTSRWGDLWPSFYNANSKRQVMAIGLEEGADVEPGGSASRSTSRAS